MSKYVDFPITESQQMPDGTTKQWPSEYKYAGKHPSGLHIFTDGDKRELFAKRRSVAGWHLIRGNWAFEFCRSE